jgi:hypothetical protein
MKKNSALFIIILVVVVIVAILLILGSNKQTNLGSNYVAPIDTSVTPGTPQTPTTTTPTPVLFSSSPLSQNAFLISTTPYDAKTKTALIGFTVTKKTQTDGSVLYTLNSTNPNYQTQTYTVKSGEKLYFIEGMPGDDNGTTDRTVADDTAVVVDANGYIVSQ